MYDLIEFNNLIIRLTYKITLSMKTISLKFLSGVIFCLLCTSSGCEKKTENDRLLFTKKARFTLVDKDSGTFLIGLDKTYHPDSIIIYTKDLKDTEYVTGLCQSKNIFFIEILVSNGPQVLINRDTTFYIRLNQHDTDTINMTYRYDETENYYFMNIKYNDIFYEGSTSFVVDPGCGFKIPK